MKATEQSFSVALLILVHKMVLNFRCVNEIISMLSIAWL